LKELLRPDRKHDLENYLWGAEVIDFLLDHPSVKFTPAEFVGLLTKLQPRLYSVASSLRAFPEQVHFIVDVVKYESRGRVRKGVASTFLAERADNVPVPVYPSLAKHFHLPDDPNTPIIMVGPGTGVAPFRAFLQERQATGAKGKTWLFFGAQRRKCDYAYGDEFEKMQEDGLLTRLDCAWSRDQAHKIYVQNKMLDNAAEIWKWIDGQGAQFFVCGDARRMAKDVDAALRKIVQEHGGKTSEQASEYVEKLKSDKRYKRDVYSTGWDPPARSSSRSPVSACCCSRHATGGRPCSAGRGSSSSSSRRWGCCTAPVRCAAPTSPPSPSRRSSRSARAGTFG
jgi:sulfite reductase (NADPH) flavoprotein alpha-component